jgi:hypothetical protein
MHEFEKKDNEFQRKTSKNELHHSKRQIAEN